MSLHILQVMSGTVAHALRLRAKDAEEIKKLSMERTASFIQLVDRMFDCLNVGNYMDGKHSCNTFKQPYRAASDFRLKVHDHILVCDVCT